MRTGIKVFLLLTVTWELVQQLPSVQGRSLPSICGCQVYEAADVPNWATFSGLEWYEVLNHPGPLHKCVVRKYYAENQTMRWIEKDGPYGDTTRTKKFDFVVEEGQQFLNKDKSFFQQILNTDFKSWALLHICSDGDRRSKFTLTLRDPLSVIPSDVMVSVSETLEKLDLSDAIRWTRSPCSVDRTLRHFPALSGLVVMYPPQGAGLPFDQSRATEKVQRAETTQQTDAPWTTDWATEVRMRDHTTPPCESDLAKETSPSRDTQLPYVTAQAQETFLPHDAVVLHESHQPWHRDNLKEFGTPQQTSGLQETSGAQMTSEPPETSGTQDTSRLQKTSGSQQTSGKQQTSEPQPTNGPQQTETAPASDQYKHPSQPLESYESKEAMTAVPLIDIRTTPWLSYVNEDESW